MIQKVDWNFRGQVKINWRSPQARSLVKLYRCTRESAGLEMVKGVADGVRAGGSAYSGSQYGNVLDTNDSGWMLIPTPLANVAAFTIAMRLVKLKAGTHEHFGYWDGSWAGSNTKQLLIRNEAVQTFVRNAANTAEANLSHSIGTNPGIWRDYVLTGDGSNLVIYMDTVATAPTSFSGAYFPDVDQPWGIGRARSGTDNDFKFFDVRFYDRAWSQTEVTNYSKRPWDLYMPLVERPTVIVPAAASFIPYPNPRYALHGGMQSMQGGV